MNTKVRWALGAAVVGGIVLAVLAVALILDPPALREQKQKRREFAKELQARDTLVAQETARADAARNAAEMQREARWRDQHAAFEAQAKQKLAQLEREAAEKAERAQYSPAFSGGFKVQEMVGRDAVRIVPYSYDGKLDYDRDAVVVGLRGVYSGREYSGPLYVKHQGDFSYTTLTGSARNIPKYLVLER